MDHKTETVSTVSLCFARKPLKRFLNNVRSLSTGLKPGVNEKGFEAKLLHTKRFLLLGLMGLVVSLAGCSFSINYVVVNESNKRIQVRFVLKEPRTPDSQDQVPSVLGTKLVSDLEDHDVQWRQLQPSQVTFNAETLTVMVSLMPKEALRVEQQSNIKCNDDNPEKAAYFSIAQINVSGSNGAITLQGEQARRSFVSGSKGNCVLTYR